MEVDTLQVAVEMVQVRIQGKWKKGASERHVQVAGGRWVGGSQPVSGVPH